MRPLVRKAILALFPPLRRIISQRNQLLLQVQAAAGTNDSSRISHRLYSTLNVNPAIGSGNSADDIRIVERLLKAYQRSPPDQYGDGSMWRDFFELHHKGFHTVFMSGDVNGARRILADPGSGNLFYGFDELCAMFRASYQGSPGGLANSCQDNLIRLAEAIGAFQIDCPEQPPVRWQENIEVRTDDILRAIETALGAQLSFPDIYAGIVGANSMRGVIPYRAIQAIYLAFRMRQLAPERAAEEPRICEIGAGLGRSALHARQLGLRNYTIVDVPMTVISQGYYLMRCLGADAVALPGEPRSSPGQIRLIYPDEFLASEDRFDLIANVDSLTELGRDLATKYLKTISVKTPAFLSINHEANPIRVNALLKDLDRPYRVSRHPYWMRQGYVEEFVEFQA